MYTGRGQAVDETLRQILDTKLELYEAFVPNKRILAAYLGETKMHLIHQIHKVFDEKIAELLEQDNRDG